MSDFQIENGVLVKYTGKGGDVVIPDEVTSIGDKAFADCRSLTSITIPNSVISIKKWAFRYCGSLTSITIPDSVTSIGELAFSGCGSLTSISIPDGVTSIGYWAFHACRSLTSISIPDSVTSIGDDAFVGCRSLTSIIIPDSVTSIGDRAFSDCRNLTSISIPDSVTSIGLDAFSDCKALAARNGFFIISNVLYRYEGKKKSITIPDNVTSIRSGAFFQCDSLTSISIPKSVTSIGECAFGGCRSLTNISIPDSVTSIGDNAFSECESLTSISIPDSVTSIGNQAFSGCSSLTSISVPDSVTSIEASAFTECENLQDFTCPSSFAKQLQTILPKTKTTIILHIPDISGMSTKFLLSAVIGFVEDKRDWSDENGKAYAKYIKTKALKLAGMAIEHPDLFYLMLREKLISAKDLDAFTKAVQDSGNMELIAAILDYANSGVSEEDKAKVQQKKETLDTNVTNFLFDATKMEKISGKTFAVTGKLKTFASRDELKACLEACGATLMENLSWRVDYFNTEHVNYLITNTPDSDTEKNRKAEKLGISRITEAQFNKMVGRKVQK